MEQVVEVNITSVEFENSTTIFNISGYGFWLSSPTSSGVENNFFFRISISVIDRVDSDISDLSGEFSSVISGPTDVDFVFPVEIGVIVVAGSN